MKQFLPTTVCLTVVLLAFLSPLPAWGASAISVGPNEQGTQKTGQSSVFHDESGELTVEHVLAERLAGAFSSLETAGSTRLKPGAYWSHFTLHNTTTEPLTLHLEYVDHQLIELEVYSRKDEGSFRKTADLSMERPFSHRPVEHNRFVVPVEVAAGETQEFLVRFGSRESGYAYPSMRIWSPEPLKMQYIRETSLIGFLFGGFFVMGLFALVAGSIGGNRLLLIYSIYAFSKIFCWATILGYTHQFVLREEFHWSLMSIGGATTILLGHLFARTFLQTREHTPKLDYVILAMITNAALLLFAAVFQIKAMALVTITLALLLYPLMIVVGVVRWRQGQREAGIFSIAWSFLVAGLIMQALRDLGLVEHSLVNYYWPPVASFTEMLTIMFAMGYKVRRLYQDKELTEQRYMEHLELSKTELEQEVRSRTRELEEAKKIAEVEARTDALTGILNRRSFMHDASLRLKLARRKGKTCCLFMFDLDHFKRINDTCGHSAGDQVLCEFTNTVARSIRETDVFGRLGGEEFALLIEEPVEAAYALAERLRADISQIKVPANVEANLVTTSIGLAISNDETTIEDLLMMADEAMYQAKAEGRNRVIRAEG